MCVATWEVTPPERRSAPCPPTVTIIRHDLQVGISSCGHKYRRSSVHERHCGVAGHGNRLPTRSAARGYRVGARPASLPSTAPARRRHATAPERLG